jgi:hypothetical protein
VRSSRFGDCGSDARCAVGQNEVAVGDDHALDRQIGEPV